MESWTLQPVINPLLLAIAIGVVVLLLLFVRPSFANLTFKRQFTLMLLRFGVIGLAALALFRPGCVQKIERNQSAVLLVLMDSTRSMQLPHQSDDSTRWGTLKEAFESNAPKLKALAEKKIDIRFFGFDNRPYVIESEDGAITLPELADGSETDIGAAVHQTSQDVRDQRLIGVIVASDGVQNASDPEVEIMESVDFLRDMEVPLWGMAFGMPADSGQLRDVAITNLPDQHAVFVKNKLTAKATLVSRGFADQRIEVQLLIESKDMPEQIVEKIEVYPSKPYEEIPIELNYVPPEPGQFRMKIRVEKQPGEVALRNNELPSFLTVYDGGLRVLYLEGNMGWEQSFLRRTIPAAAQGIEIDFVPIYPNTRAEWPNPNYAEFFDDPTYDVFILGDLDSTALHDPGKRPTRNLEALARAVVERNKGLLLLGGYHSFGPGKYHRTPLAEVIPIEMDDTERQDFDAEVRRDLHIERPVQLVPARNDFLTRLSEDEDSRAIWKSLPKLTGANKFFDVKPNSEVLLETVVGKNPILVKGEVGGRVLAFAGDSSWRWYMHDHKEEYNRFWRQIILWLAFRDGKTDDNVWVDLPQRRYQPKAPVTFRTGARNQVGETLVDANFVSTLIKPNGETEAISIATSPEKNWGQLNRDSLAEPGVYTIEVVGSRQGEEVGRSSVEFIVFDRDKEKSNPSADPDLMQRLASQTADFGGKRIFPEELGELLDEIYNNPPQSVIEVPTKWRLGETVPDALGFLFIFVGLLATEWFFRKKWGLV